MSRPGAKPLIVPRGSLRTAGLTSSSTCAAVGAAAADDAVLGDLAGLDGNLGGRLGREAGAGDDGPLVAV